MKRLIIATAALALGLPGAALAADTPAPAKNAAKACKAEREGMGAAAFKATYGTNKKQSNAFGKCVSKRTKVEKAVVSEAKSACKAERQADPEAFAAKYGTGKKGRNAYGKCVSGAAKEASADETEDKVNAAKACKAERKADKDAFAEKYGTNKNKRNAFGKCVSQAVKAEEETDEETEETAPVA